MKNKLPKALNELADFLGKDATLYAVGGSVRNFLLGLDFDDIDITSSLPPSVLIEKLKGSRFKVADSNLRVGTVIVASCDFKAEYTCFRQDSYPVGGAHTPAKVEFCTDIALDAKRRDFKANAVYYDISKGIFVDPLGGMEDIKNKILSATVTPQKVFSEDGLRILRLCRFAAELGFDIEDGTMEWAIKMSDNVLDISKERIATELKKILSADVRYPSLNNEYAHYRGLKLLDEATVLTKLFPVLKEGKGVAQNPKYHDYDVFEHIMQTVKFAPPSVRLAALFHDVAKPMCLARDGNMYNHPLESAAIARRELGATGLKLSNAEVDFTCRLIENHMYNLLNETKTPKLKWFLAKNHDIAYDLISLIRADAMAAKGVTSPSADRMESLFNDMLKAGVPLCVKELKIKGEDVLDVRPKKRSEILNKVWEKSVKYDLLTYEQQLKALGDIKRQIIKEKK